MDQWNEGVVARVVAVAVLKPQYKSLYRRRAGSQFYRTEYDIWADFGLLAILKKIWCRL